MPRTLSEWLEQTAWDKEYWAWVKAKAKSLNTDGCSGVPDWYVWTCWEHDIHYATHIRRDGNVFVKLTKKEADHILWIRITQSSPLGRFSYVAWSRWLGLSTNIVSREAWEGK